MFNVVYALLIHLIAAVLANRVLSKVCLNNQLTNGIGDLHSARWQRVKQNNVELRLRPRRSCDQKDERQLWRSVT